MNEVIKTDFIKANITVDMWDMESGEFTAFKYKGRIFRAEPVNEILGLSVENAIDKKTPGQKCVVEKYILFNGNKVFYLSKFFKDNPKQQKFKTRITGYISKLISDDKLIQLSDDRFQVTTKLIN